MQTMDNGDLFQRILLVDRYGQPGSAPIEFCAECRQYAPGPFVSGHFASELKYWYYPANLTAKRTNRRHVFACEGGLPSQSTMFTVARAGVQIGDSTGKDAFGECLAAAASATEPIAVTAEDREVLLSLARAIVE